MRSSPYEWTVKQASSPKEDKRNAAEGRMSQIASAFFHLKQLQTTQYICQQQAAENPLLDMPVSLTCLAYVLQDNTINQTIFVKWLAKQPIVHLKLYPLPPSCCMASLQF